MKYVFYKKSKRFTSLYLFKLISVVHLVDLCYIYGVRVPIMGILRVWSDAL